MFSNLKHRLLDIIMNKFSEKSFSICIMSSITDFVHTNIKDGVCFHYTVPENLCRSYIINNNETKPQFATSAIMAIFDEISTYSTCIQDKNHRPGVSVHLSTEIMKPIYTNEKLTVLTKADKLGKSIGYCTMELLNSNNELVARGKHIRYLHMGNLFNVMTHPMLLPWAINLYEVFNKKKETILHRVDGKSIFSVPPGYPKLDGIGQVFNILGLKSIQNKDFIADIYNNVSSSDIDSSSNTSSSSDNNTLYCSKLGRIQDISHISAYSMTVQPILCNLLGNMHGGAVACAVEQACVLARIEKVGAVQSTTTNTNITASTTTPTATNIVDGKYNLNCYVQSIDIRYISAMQGDLTITVIDDIYSHYLHNSVNTTTNIEWLSKTYGKVYNQKNNTICAEYICTWAANS